MRSTRFRHRGVLWFGLLTLAGCQPVWVANDAATPPFNEAVSQCQAATRLGWFGAGIVAEMNKQVYLDRCIASRGYRQVDPHDLPPGQRGYAVVAPVGPIVHPFSRD